MRRSIHYWRDSYFQSLKDVAAEARAIPEWADFATYCIDHERGLRRQAFVALERFICSMQAAPFAERKRFISWLLRCAEGRKGWHMLIPQPIRVRLIEPTCVEWILVEPASSEPHRWLGTYEHLELAMELAPADEIAARRFVNLILGTTQYATHELPAGFLGDPLECLQDLDKAEAVLSALSAEAERNQYASEIEADRNLIQAYLARTRGGAT